MKTYILTLCLFCFGCVALNAQRKGVFSPEEYNARQQAFITDYANLTADEAAKFFPLYYELQARKRELHNQNRKMFKQGRNPMTTDKEYKNIVETSITNRIAAEKLDYTYLKQFQKILSPKKVYAVECAEFMFNREVLKKITDKRPQPDK